MSQAATPRSFLLALILIGGDAGTKTRIGQELVAGLNDEQALVMVDKILQYYKANAKKGNG